MFVALLLLLASPATVVMAAPPPYSRLHEVLHAVDRSLKSTREARSFLTAHARASDNSDCHELVEMALEDLEEVRSKLGRPERGLTPSRTHRIRTLTSAALTSLDTCLDGMVEKRANSGKAYQRIQEAHRLSGDALRLVVAALDWVHRIKPPSDHSYFQHAKPSVLTQIIDGVPQNQILTVAKDGSGDFETIQEAIDHAPKKTKHGYFKIAIKEGVYRENVIIKKKKNIVFLGAGIDKTVITGSRSNSTRWSTYKSATLAVFGRGFIFSGITVENTARPELGQAVALMCHADLAVFYKCSFKGHQDTLYAHAKTQFYRECDIYGTLDFMFGNAIVVFQACNIYVIKPVNVRQNAIITAQGRKHPYDISGMSIHNCTIRPAKLSCPNGTKTYLGRPWKKYSRTVFMESYLGELIEPAGWTEFREDFALDTLFYGEYGNYGPGARTEKRVQWKGYNRMNMRDAINFTVNQFISGYYWLPKTSVPYYPGLLE